ncbi:MAG: hypothetical protein BMS9Abin28_1065 [Anaerolineae bacterium]|nr:MAG: hypothetical protein BMS9Abin28_1065 [Anaerolineae bacterium]
MQQFIGKMSRMYPLLIVMGFMMVAIAFVVGYFNSQAAASYFSQPKVLRETTLLAERAAIESIDLWLPYFKFLGIGLILGGIVMALRVIIDRLRGAGEEVLENLPAKIRPALPSPPWYAPMMPMIMVLGLLIYIVALIVALGSAADARALFANPIPAIDAAGAGTALLATLSGIKATSAWLVPLKFFGTATEFLAIAMGLSTIIWILSQQTEMIAQGIDIGRTRAKAARREDERAPAYADN